jgi:hypothetical protein
MICGVPDVRTEPNLRLSQRQHFSDDHAGDQLKVSMGDLSHEDRVSTRDVAVDEEIARGVFKGLAGPTIKVGPIRPCLQERRHRKVSTSDDAA